MSSTSVTVSVSSRVMLGVEQVCKDYALSLLKIVSDARGLDFESLLEGVELPRLVFGDDKRDKVVREKVVREKVVREKVVRDLPKCVLPFLGVLDGCCKGVIRNNNLYTQCLGLPKSDDLCNKCIKSKDSGKFLGLITDRKVGDVEFSTGAKVVKISSYVDVVRKLNIVKDAAVADALRFGWSLSDDYFEEKEKARGRPKKVAVECDKKDDKSRGRPKKDKKVVSSGVEGDDLIAKLVAEVSNDDKSSSSSPSSEDDNEVDVPSDAPRMAAVSVAPKKAKASGAEKELEKAKKVAEKAEKEAEKEAEKAKKVAEKAKKEAEKAKKAKKVKTPTPPPMAVAASLEEEDSESSESPAKVVTVKKFDFGGKKYKLSSENILYDWETDNPVGIWNAEKKCIDEYENSSEEESDEE